MNKEIIDVFAYIKAQGNGITREEVCSHFDYDSDITNDIIDHLERRGYIFVNVRTRDDNTKDVLWVQNFNDDEAVSFTRRVRKFHSKKGGSGVALPEEVLAEIGAFEGQSITITASNGRAVITRE